MWYWCARCGIEMSRKFSFNTTPPSTQFDYEGYSPAAGAHVSSKREFNETLKRKSDLATERTGVEHSYVPLHPSEVQSVAKVTTEGLDPASAGYARLSESA